VTPNYLCCHKRNRETSPFELRLNSQAMGHPLYLPRLVALSLAALLFAPLAARAQQDQDNRKPLPMQPGVPGMGSNHRLILKDGSYQVVRQYEIVGDRVRYLSQERGDWEEMPADLIDWDATRKWEHDHAASAADDQSTAMMKEAEELDKEEAGERQDEKNRMPEVARGLQLPDQDGVFVLDTFQGTPELVELQPVDLNINQHSRHGLSTFNPLASQRASIELDGSHARVHLHVNDPAIYLSLDSTDDTEPPLAHAMTVQTGGARPVANGRHGAHSPTSGFAIVRVDERRAVRIVGAIHISPTGKVSQSEDVIPATSQVLPGKHWLKIIPEQPLTIGEYALVEILSPTDINQTVWDFSVKPTEGDNPSALTPIVQQ